MCINLPKIVGKNNMKHIVINKIILYLNLKIKFNNIKK